MILVLNTSGILHASSACAGSGYTFTLDEGEELVGFLGYEFQRFCAVCLGDPYGDRRWLAGLEMAA